MASASPPSGNAVLGALAGLLTIATAYLVYDSSVIGLDTANSLYVLWGAVPLGLLLLYKMTAAKPGRWEAQLNELARLEPPPAPEADPKSRGPLRTPGKNEPGAPKLKRVNAAPAELAALLERSGDGAPVAFFEIHPKLAYIAVTEANAMNASDCTTVLMKLEASAPSFEARPLVPIDPTPPDVVGFPKDAEFNARYVVVGSDPKRIRSFLSEPLRDELADAPATWVEAEGKALAVSLYGDFDARRAYRLLETADIFFAEYGADGGSTLLEPTSTTPKKKKKKKPDAPGSDPAESPA